MMFVKLRKLKSLLGKDVKVSLMLDAIKLCGLTYTFKAFPFNNSSMDTANRMITKMGWNPDTTLVMPVKSKNYRILLAVDNITLDELVKQTKRLNTIKAFL
jgi:hypothetical protein